jgi:DNA-3-methyladenine glycosylase II
VAPQHVLSLGDDVMRACAISRQKSRYLKLLAEAILEGTLDLAALSNLSDSKVADQLMQITGIGQWTADVYRLMCPARPDIWPCGDVALAKALQEVKRLSARPDLENQLGIAEPWRPYRSAAARLLWHHSLCRRGRQA